MVSSNVFHNEAAIAKMALEILHNNLNTGSRVNRKYDSTFGGGAGAQQGDTFNVRLPGFATYRTGAVAAPTGMNDTYVPVVLAQGGSDFKLTSQELTLNIDDLKTQVLAPQMAVVFNSIDAGILANYKKISQFAGVPGTAITNLTPFLQARAVMEKQSSCPLDGRISGMLDADTQAGAVGGLTTLFNPTKEIAGQYRNGSMGNAAGLDFYSTANAPAHTIGTWHASTPVIATPAVIGTGGVSVTTSGWASSNTTLNEGDVFTISGVYAVNPVSKTLTTQLKQFRVASTVSDTSGAITLVLDPPMVVSGPLQNINAMPVQTAPIYMYSVAGTAPLNTSTGAVSAQSLVFHQDAFVLAMADLEKPTPDASIVSDPISGLSCRVAKYWDGVNDSSLYRVDVLWGTSVLRPGFAARVLA